MDFLLVTETDDENPVIGDLKLTNGQITLTPTLAVAVAQRLSIRLRFFLSEWFLNKRAGTPWFEQVFIKDPSVTGIRALLTKIATGTPGVESVQALEVDYDEDERSLAVPVFDVKCIDGSIVSAADVAAYIVET